VTDFVPVCMELCAVIIWD